MMPRVEERLVGTEGGRLGYIIYHPFQEGVEEISMMIVTAMRKAAVAAKSKKLSHQMKMNQLMATSKMRKIIEFTTLLFECRSCYTTYGREALTQGKERGVQNWIAIGGLLRGCAVQVFFGYLEEISPPVRKSESNILTQHSGAVLRI